MRYLRSNSVIGAQEEGEYEYASYQGGGTGSNEEAHVGPATLVQPLQESTGEGQAKAGTVVRLCKDAGHEAGNAEPCARYVEVFGWINKHIVQPVKHFVHKVVKIVKEVFEHPPRCYPNEILGGGQCSSAPPGSPGNPIFPFPEP
jgi:hypothetical protein